MKRLTIILALVVAGGALALVAGALAGASKNATLVIHHYVRGCHAWSLNGGPDKVRQVVRLSRGASLTVTNNDLMVQDLVKTSGPAVKMKLVQHSHMDTHMTMPMNGKASPYAMAHMGAQVKVTFPQAGTYHFNLIDRGDYYKGIKAIGEDNQPTLTVNVS